MKLAKKGTFSIDNFIPLIMGVLVFMALIGTIANQIYGTVNPSNGTALTASNLSGGASVLLALTTLILVIGFIISIYKAKY